MDLARVARNLSDHQMTEWLAFAVDARAQVSNCNFCVDLTRKVVMLSGGPMRVNHLFAAFALLQYLRHGARNLSQVSLFPDHVRVWQDDV